MHSQNPGRIFYGWYIVAMAFAANFLTVGTGFYILNAFMQPLCETHGWTRTQVNTGLMFGYLFGYVAQLGYGALVEKAGPRRLMLWGPFVAGFSFILLGQVTTLGQFYAVFILLAIGNGAFGGIIANSAVSNWFVLKRGRALGVSSSAISLSGVVVPLAAQAMLLKTSMALTCLFIGLVVIAYGPAAWLVVRDWPEDQGLLPDGAKSPDGRGLGSVEAARSLQESETTGYWSLKRLVRTPAFWKVGLSYAMAMAGVMGVMSQLKPRFSDLGFDDMTAMYLMSGSTLVGTFGKYFWGMLCDKFDVRRVVAVLMAANGLGLGIGLISGSALATYAFAAIYGFAMAGVMSTYPIIVADLFGRRSFTQVSRYMVQFLILQLAGLPLAGKSYDLTGSYNTAYVVFGALALGASCLIMTVKRPGPAPRTLP